MLDSVRQCLDKYLNNQFLSKKKQNKSKKEEEEESERQRARLCQTPSGNLWSCEADRAVVVDASLS